MGIGVDREQATGLDSHPQQPPGRIEPFGSRVHLDGYPESLAGGEDDLGVELRFGPPTSSPTDEPAGAVAEHVDVRVGDRGHHPRGHLVGRHAQSTVDTRDDEVEASQQRRFLVEPTVVEDVDLDAREDPERSEFVVDRRHLVELAFQALGGQPVGDGEPRRVVGQHQVLVAQVARRLGHLADRRSAVGPLGVGVAVTAQGGPQRRAAVDQRTGAGLELVQVRRLDPGQRLGDAPGGGLADAGQRSQRLGERPVEQLVLRGCLGRRRRRAKRPHPIGRLQRPLEQERDPPQISNRIARAHHEDVTELTQPPETEPRTR